MEMHYHGHMHQNNVVIYEIIRQHNMISKVYQITLHISYRIIWHPHFMLHIFWEVPNHLWEIH